MLFENSVFANIGTQDSVVFNCTRGVLNCAGVAIENFNDCKQDSIAQCHFVLLAEESHCDVHRGVVDDNTFDGCHFFNNSWGIANGGMANVCESHSQRSQPVTIAPTI